MPIIVPGHLPGGGKGAEEAEEGASKQQCDLESPSGRTEVGSSILKSWHPAIATLSEFCHLIYVTLIYFILFHTTRDFLILVRMVFFIFWKENSIRKTERTKKQ